MQQDVPCDASECDSPGISSLTVPSLIQPATAAKQYTAASLIKGHLSACCVNTPTLACIS